MGLRCHAVYSLTNERLLFCWSTVAFNWEKIAKAHDCNVFFFFERVGGGVRVPWPDLSLFFKNKKEKEKKKKTSVTEIQGCGF